MFKLFIKLAVIAAFVLVLITVASFAVYKFSQTGEIPDGKAGEIATWLLKWHATVNNWIS